jgi:hypothetical protein
MPGRPAEREMGVDTPHELVSICGMKLGGRGPLGMTGELGTTTGESSDRQDRCLVLLLLPGLAVRFLLLMVVVVDGAVAVEGGPGVVKKAPNGSGICC